MTAAPQGGPWQLGGVEGGWWAVERAKFLADRLRPAARRSRLAVDLGCGRGEVVELLTRQGAGFVVGVDVEVFPTWRRHPGRVAYVVADVGNPPLRPGVADLISLLDVIEHFPDDATPLRSARLVAADEATVAVTVPARPELWSPFDDHVGHHRRYTSPTLDAAVRGNGFEPIDTTYFFSWLALPAFVLRRRDRAGADAPRAGWVGRAVVASIRALCALERTVLRRWSLPIGTSLWVRCRPEPASDHVRAATPRPQEPPAPG